MRVGTAVQDGSSELGSQGLNGTVESIRQVSRSDTVALADTVSAQTNVERLAVPVAWDTADELFQAVGVASGRAAILVHIGGEASSHAWVADEEGALDRVEVVASQLRHGVDCCGSSLRVAFEEEAGRRVGGEGGSDLVDDLRVRGCESARSRR